jgi:hypothetical protein
VEGVNTPQAEGLAWDQIDPIPPSWRKQRQKKKKKAIKKTKKKTTKKKEKEKKEKKEEKKEKKEMEKKTSITRSGCERVMLKEKNTRCSYLCRQLARPCCKEVKLACLRAQGEREERKREGGRKGVHKNPLLLLILLFSLPVPSVGLFASPTGLTVGA